MKTTLLLCLALPSLAACGTSEPEYRTLAELDAPTVRIEAHINYAPIARVFVTLGIANHGECVKIAGFTATIDDVPLFSGGPGWAHGGDCEPLVVQGELPAQQAGQTSRAVVGDGETTWTIEAFEIGLNGMVLDVLEPGGVGAVTWPSAQTIDRASVTLRDASQQVLFTNAPVGSPTDMVTISNNKLSFPVPASATGYLYLDVSADRPVVPTTCDGPVECAIESTGNDDFVYRVP